LRARSRWLAHDVAALALAGTVAWAAISRLWRSGALGSLALGLGVYGALATAALFSAHLAALDRGRSDLLRAARALSRRLWSTLLPATVALLLFAVWTLSPTPADVREAALVQPSPNGEWLAYSGRLAGRFELERVFLWHPSSGRFVRIPDALSRGQAWQVTFSRDGRVAAWIESEGNEWAVWRLDLVKAAREKAAPERTNVAFAAFPNPLKLSPDGRLIASRERGRWLLAEVATGRLVASSTDDGYDAGSTWVAADRLRIFTLAGFDRALVTASAWDLSSAANASAQHVLFSTRVDRDPATAFATDLGGYAAMSASLDGRRVLVRDQNGWRLLDADGGRLLAVVSGLDSSKPSSDGPHRPLFLPDGRVVVRQRTNGLSELHFLDRDGKPLSAIALGPATRVVPAGLPGPDTFWLAAYSREEPRLLEISLAASPPTVRELARNVLPALMYEPSVNEGQLPTGAAARWLVDIHGRLRFLRQDGVLTSPGGPE
jgi:hypothetical protein